MGLCSAVRWARAAGFAVVCAGLAALGHSLAGGQVGRFALATCALLVFLPALALTGREHSIRTILPAVAACQVGLHLLLSQLSAAHAMPQPIDPAVLAAHGMAGHGAAAHGMEMPASHGGSPGFGMLLMHAIATLIASRWLEYGESGLCGLVRTLAAWVWRAVVWIRPVTVHCPSVAAPVVWVRRPVPTRALRHVLARRGPPAAATTPALG